MSKFRVHTKSVSFLYLDVEAESEEEAREIAEDTDAGEFEQIGYEGYFELMEIEREV